MSAISLTYRAVPLQIDELIASELPFCQALYNHHDELHQDIQECFSFFIENQHHLPLYCLSEHTATRLQTELSQYYLMLKDALKNAFELPLEQLRPWFACSAANEVGFGTFVDYAKTTFEDHRRNQSRIAPASSAIYGRLDAAVDPQSGKILGVYEFNGDTPVMLFESINLQNKIATALEHTEDQANDWWFDTQARLQAFAGKTVAVVCAVSHIEDCTTSETIAQVFEALGAQVYFSTIESLNHTLLDIEKPFRIDGVATPPDAVFMLLPWEEMWTSGRDVLAHWPHWYQHVSFFEPPWRWFMSHKGLLAWASYLYTEDEAFAQRWAHVPHLHTELSADYFIEHQLDYVIKPVIGRLSQNIQVIQNNQLVTQTEGHYGHEPMIYQQYCPPHQVSDRPNMIVGGWLAGDRVATLCFREFDGAVLDLQNERFIAHLLKTPTV